MKSDQNISVLKIPRELGGVLVCDALMLRGGIVITGPTRKVLVLAIV